MVSLVVGFPGSGKSYYAVKKIYDILSTKSTESSQYEVIYTNIGGIKFDYFPDSKVEFKKLKEDQLLSYLSECFKIYEEHKDKENVDDYLIEYSKEQNFYNALIVFDECHDFFTPQDRVKIFWLTYHRHLNHEIILLTQNKSLINSKYRAIPEQFIEAQPRSKKLFSSTLNYKHYASFAMRKSDQFNSSSIKTDPKIFDLYQSGNKSAQKSILVKFIVILGFGLVVAVFLFYNLLNGFGDGATALDENLSQLENKQHQLHNDKKVPKDGIKPSKYQSNKNDDIDDPSYTKQFNIEVFYNSNDGYKIYDNYYDKNYFKKFIATTKSRILYKTTIVKLDDYEMEKLILKTSFYDIDKYFYIDQKYKTNNFEAKRRKKR